MDVARQVGLRGLADELIQSLERELDYTSEALNGEQFREHRSDEEGIDAPNVYESLTTRRVLVMQEVEGTTVADHAAVEDSGVAPLVLSRRLLGSFISQVLHDGMYHADPHPGNVFVDHRGTLWFLDFGSVGYLDPLLLESMQQLAIGFQLRDPVVLARALRSVGAGRDGEAVDTRALEADIAVVLSEGLVAGTFDPRAISLMLDMMRRHGLRPPRSLTLLSRALLTLEGTLRTIDPDFVLAREAERLLPSLTQLDTGAIRDQLQRELARALPSLRTLPGHTEEIAAALRAGRLGVRVERYAGADRGVVEGWLDRVLFAAVGAFGLLSSAVLLVASGLANTEGLRQALAIVGIFGVIIASVMQMRSIAQVLRGPANEDPGWGPGQRRVEGRGASRLMGPGGASVHAVVKNAAWAPNPGPLVDRGSSMQLGMVGLGRMGANMVRRLERAGHHCVVYDLSAEAVSLSVADGATGSTSWADFVGKVEVPRAVWLMVPAAVVDETLATLVPLLASDDVVIDGGNSYYHDDLRRSGELAAKGLHYVDVGTSGGVFGLERGYCLMIGGDAAAVARLQPVFEALAPGVGTTPRTPGRESAEPSPAEQGWLHCGPSGAGHFVKMVHNGIEYGLMAAYAEGLNVLHHADAGLRTRAADAETTPLRHPELYLYQFDLRDVTEVWRRGSVIASWLLDLTAQALWESPQLDDFAGRVSDSGEGRWTVLAAIDEGAPAPVLSTALFERFTSRGESDFADKVLSAMRFEFGGHKEKPASGAAS